MPGEGREADEGSARLHQVGSAQLVRPDVAASVAQHRSKEQQRGGRGGDTLN